MKIYGILEKHGKKELFISSRRAEMLYVNEDPADVIREESCRVISYMILILGIAALTAVGSVLAGSSAINGGRLARKGAEEGTADYSLSVASDDGYEEDITVSVSGQRYTGSELENFFERAFAELEKETLGKNGSAENVTEDLHFPSSIADGLISVTWEDVDHSYIYSNGDLRKEEITEPVILLLTARLEYYGEVRIHSFPVRLVPGTEEDALSFSKRLEEALKKEDLESSDTPWFRLPEVLDGSRLAWGERKKNKYLWILALGIGAAASVVPAIRSEYGKKEKAREEEMLRDYPDIISKYVLLVTAGMTCRGAWEKICSDYRNSGRKGRFAYEEMIRSEHEMRFGVSEAGVYENFGRRCGVDAYRKFGMLLSNNLRRGSRDLTLLLKSEASEAMEKRREEAARSAQEASTRLLLPMFGMLCLVFAIIMVPAFSSFGG